jgi:hypothetical protein
LSAVCLEEKLFDPEAAVLGIHGNKYSVTGRSIN